MDTPRPDAESMWSSPAPAPATPEAPGTPAAPGASPGGTEPQPTFATTRRGFDQRQVLDHIAQLTAKSRTLEEHVRRLQAANEQLTQQRDAAIADRDASLQAGARQPEPYEQVSTRVAEILAGLDRDVERIKAEATVEGELIIANARTEAELLRREAEAARAEAARSLTDLQERRGSMLDQLRRTCDDFLEVIQSLAASIEDRAPEGPVVVPEVAEERPAS